MKRREFFGVLAGATGWLHAARAQQGVRQIGLISPFTAGEQMLWNKALLQGLRDLGWIEGKNLAIDYRYAEGRKELLPELATALVQQKPDLIISTVTLDTQAVRKATREIPIVMVAVGDPVGIGIVDSLARPGGNITGLSQMTPDLSGKRLELLREIAPRVSRVAILYDPDDALSVLDWKEASRSAQKIGFDVHSHEVRHVADFDKAFNEALASRVEALVIMPAPVLFENIRLIADFAKQNRLASTFHLREFASVGGLVSYGVDRTDLFRRAATYIDKILKGARPADLPIEQPTKFELVINTGTARAIGVTVPPNVLSIADNVIE